MARFEITAPAPTFTGTAAGVVFTDGHASVEAAPDSRVLARLARLGFTVVDPAAPVELVEADPDEQPAEPKPARSNRKTGPRAGATESNTHQTGD